MSSYETSQRSKLIIKEIKDKLLFENDYDVKIFDFLNRKIDDNTITDLFREYLEMIEREK